MFLRCTCLQSVRFFRFLGDLKVVQQRAVQVRTQTLVSTSLKCKRQYYDIMNIKMTKVYPRTISHVRNVRFFMGEMGFNVTTNRYKG